MADLKIFAKTVEQEVHRQIDELVKLKAFENAKIRIMPDTHAGKGCVIGFTADLGDKVIPNIVGCDVGCGVLVVNLGKVEFNDSKLSELDKFIRENIPSGLSVNDSKHTIKFDRLKDLRMYDSLRKVEHLHSSICSLGGGNHYIELDKSKDGDVYLTIHTGSRNLGIQVANYYQKLAIKDCNDHKDEIDKEVAKVISEYKSKGRDSEISEAIKEIKSKFSFYGKIPEDLCYLEGLHRDDYLHDMKICQEFAVLNREMIAKRVMDFLGIDAVDSFCSVHNYIDFEDNIVRKGAIRCNKGEKVVIPLNMASGAIIGIGKGNEDWNCSGPHGAGRLMSRKRAKELISIDDFKDAMKGIFTTSVDYSTIDESPMAYKDANEIIELVKDTVDIIDVVVPIYNFKASG